MLTSLTSPKESINANRVSTSDTSEGEYYGMSAFIEMYRKLHCSLRTQFKYCLLTNQISIVIEVNPYP